MRKFFAGIVKKHKISDNKYIFTYVDSCIVEMEEDVNDKEDVIFIDGENKKYFSMINRTCMDDNTDLFVGPIQSVENFKKDYDVLLESSVGNFTDEDFLGEFKEKVQDLFFLVINNGDRFIYTSYSSRLSNPEISEREDLDEYSVYEDQGDYENDDTYYDVTSLVSDIVAGKFSLNELKNMRQTLIEREEELSGVISTIELELDSKVDTTLDNPIDLYKERGLININDVFTKVTKTLVAQDEAAIQLITHIAMLDMKSKNDKGILLTGSTGVGKTKLMSLVAKYLDRPFLLVDTTQVTVPGWAGRDIEEYLYKLLENCNFNRKKAERAIIFFDEIDKKGEKGENTHSTRAVLEFLLKFLDGTTYIACKNMQSKAPGTFQEIDTSSMIVVAGGAFTNVYNNPYDKKVYGFGSNNSENSKMDVTVQDFVKKGNMTDEFMGRFSTIIHLNDLKALEYKKILLESDESPIIFAKNIFDKMDNVKLSFTDEYLQRICKIAEKKGTGVRGLSGIVDSNIVAPFKEINANLGVYEEVILDEDVLENAKSYKLLKKNKIN